MIHIYLDKEIAYQPNIHTYLTVWTKPSLLAFVVTADFITLYRGEHSTGTFTVAVAFCSCICTKTETFIRKNDLRKMTYYKHTQAGSAH